MSTRVLLAAQLRPELGISGSDAGLPVVDIRHPDAFESSVRTLMAGDGQVIIACAPADHDEVRRLLTWAEVRIPGLRACIEVLPGTPLAIGVLASLIDDLGSSDEPDAVAWQLSAFDVLRASAWSAVWLPSVTKLTHPAPSVAQHARSMLPGSGYLAVVSPDPQVLPARSAPIAGIDPRPESVLIHAPTEAPAWVREAVETAVRPAGTNQMQPVRATIDTYGTNDAAEMVAVPQRFDLASRPEHVAECPACQVRHARATCPFCAMTVVPEGAPL